MLKVFQSSNSLQLSKQTSKTQNFDLQVGQGEQQDIHVPGELLSCRLANHFPMHSKHHIGRQ